MGVSILNSIKQQLGIEESDTAFDMDITMLINSALANLHQLGIGPLNGFRIQDASAQWDHFMGDDPRLNMVQPFVFMRVRRVFDPPTTAHMLAALKDEIEELTWRIEVSRHPLPPSVPINQPANGPAAIPVMLDGGDADNTD